MSDPHPPMPHVFVIPPEEEHSQNPPWCCFDANVPPENSASIDVNDVLLDVPFLLPQSEPSPQPLSDQPDTSPVVTPQTKNSSSISRSEKRQRPQDIITPAIRGHDQVRTVRRDVHDDSDVIEIVKLRRSKDHKTNTEDHVPPSPSNPEPHLKRSKTLRARASRALQSIKNVSLTRGKQTNGRPPVKELWRSNESTPGIFKGVLHSQGHVRVPHRKLSGFFKSSQGDGILSSSSSRSSVSDIRPSYEFIERPLTPCAPTYDYRLRHPISSADFRGAPSPESKPSKDVKRTISSQDLSCPDDESRHPVSSQDLLRDERSSSSTTRSRTRFSVNELHRLFSFAPESPSPPTFAPSITSTPISIARSHPDVPCAAMHFVDDDYGKEIDGKYGRSLDLLDRDGDGHLDTPDVSFEMRLESLHFDSLSFNAEEFNGNTEVVELGVSQC